MKTIATIILLEMEILTAPCELTRQHGDGVEVAAWTGKFLVPHASIFEKSPSIAYLDEFAIRIESGSTAKCRLMKFERLEADRQMFELCFVVVGDLQPPIREL